MRRGAGAAVFLSGAEAVVPTGRRVNLTVPQQLCDLRAACPPDRDMRIDFLKLHFASRSLSTLSKSQFIFQKFTNLHQIQNFLDWKPISVSYIEI